MARSSSPSRSLSSRARAGRQCESPALIIPARRQRRWCLWIQRQVRRSAGRRARNRSAGIAPGPDGEIQRTLRTRRCERERDAVAGHLGCRHGHPHGVEVGWKDDQDGPGRARQDGLRPRWRRSMEKVRRSDFEQDIADTVRGLQLVRNPAYLTYVGVETIDKHKLHHLKANRTFTYATGSGTGTYDKFDVWVKDDGTPVLVKGKISAVGAYGLKSLARPRCASRRSADRSRSWRRRTSAPLPAVASSADSRQDDRDVFSKRLPYRSLIVVLAVLSLGVAWLDQPRPTEAASANIETGTEAASANLSAWTGGVNLYRKERSRPRSRGCGARRPASRSCATSSTGRPITARPTSVATSTGCAVTTGTPCRCRRVSIRQAGPPACAISSTTATGWSRAGHSTRRSDPRSNGSG